MSETIELPSEALKEARVQARLAWNGWPDSEASRREIAAHETRDPISAIAWDRVIAAVRTDGLREALGELIKAARDYDNSDALIGSAFCSSLDDIEAALSPKPADGGG